MNTKLKRMNAQDFEALKGLQRVGIKPIKAGAAVGYPSVTVRRVYAADTLAKYREVTTAANASAPHLSAKNRPERQPYYASEYVRIAESTNTIIKSIDERLKFIEENMQINPSSSIWRRKNVQA